MHRAQSDRALQSIAERQSVRMVAALALAWHGHDTNEFFISLPEDEDVVRSGRHTHLVMS